MNSPALRLMRMGSTIIVGLLVAVGCAKGPLDVERAVENNKAAYVVKWLKSGGNPNLTNVHGESLLYIATGPHGGHAVLEVLLSAGAKVDAGAGKYTPLMNAASWCDLEAVQLLLKHGANPNRQNGKGQRAVDVVGSGGGAEVPILDLLRRVTSATQ